MRVFAIVAVSKNDVIGRGRKIPWHIPEDMRRFRELTKGHTVVMGRLTYESIGRPLPDRRNIVISRNPAFAPSGVLVLPSIEKALEAGGEIVFVIGGERIYEESMKWVECIYLTRVNLEVDGDAFFRLPAVGFQLVAREDFGTYTFETYEKLKSMQR